jgi:hypothetical protein
VYIAISSSLAAAQGKEARGWGPATVASCSEGLRAAARGGEQGTRCGEELGLRTAVVAAHGGEQGSGCGNRGTCRGSSEAHRGATQ